MVVLVDAGVPDVVAATVSGVIGVVPLVAGLLGRHIDGFGLLVLAEIVASVAVTLVSDDPRFVLARVAIYTTVAGIYALVTCVVGRPFMLDATKPMAAASDPVRAVGFENARASNPSLRTVERMMRIGLGVVLIAESVLRVVVVYGTDDPNVAVTGILAQMPAIVLFIGWFLLVRSSGCHGPAWPSTARRSCCAPPHRADAPTWCLSPTSTVPGMRFYAERPVRLFRQLLADVFVVAWVVVVVILARAAYDLIQQLQGPARTLADAGDAIGRAFAGAARTAGNVPFVGGDLARALGTGTGAGDSLAAAGRDQVQTVTNVALGTAVGIVVLAALPVVLVWLTLRVRYARAARSAVTVRTTDTDLLALRALAHMPVRTLLEVSDDPAAAWRRDDRDVVRELAALELRSLGLRPPRTAVD